MASISDRCDALADEARELMMDVEFRASFAECRGKLTMSHVSLHSAKLAAARLKEAVDRIAAEADTFVTMEPAE